MKAIVLAAAALSLIACDDPEVGAKATDVLEFGLVQAKVECAGVDTQNCGWPTTCSQTTCSQSGSHTFRGQRLVDGSALVTINWYPVILYGRVDPEAEEMQVSFDNDVFTVADGVLTVTDGGNEFCTCPPLTYDLETECSGYNLGVFGVE